MNDTITCIQCQQNKPTDLFNKSSLRRSYFCCKQCVAIRDKQYRENNKINPKPPITHKTCKKCGLILTIENFSKHRQSKNGYFSWCKICHNKYEKDLRAKTAKTPKKEIEGKTCKSCGLYKPSEEYYTFKHLRDGLSTCCKKCGRARSLAYSQKPAAKTRRLQRIKERTETDPTYKLTLIIRNRIRDAIKRQTKSACSKDLLGCTGAECMDYLEKLFWPGMTRNNMGVRGWVVDHITPVDSFDKNDPNWQFKCFRYTNLQPLWKQDNEKKLNRLDWSPSESKYELPDRLKNPIDFVQNGVTLVPSQ